MDNCFGALTERQAGSSTRSAGHLSMPCCCFRINSAAVRSRSHSGGSQSHRPEPPARCGRSRHAQNRALGIADLIMVAVGRYLIALLMHRLPFRFFDSACIISRNQRRGNMGQRDSRSLPFGVARSHIGGAAGICFSQRQTLAAAGGCPSGIKGIAPGGDCYSKKSALPPGGALPPDGSRHAGTGPAHFGCPRAGRESIFEIPELSEPSKAGTAGRHYGSPGGIHRSINAPV